MNTSVERTASSEAEVTALDWSPVPAWTRVYEEKLRARRFAPLHVLKIGTWQSASLPRWERLLPSARFVAIDSVALQSPTTERSDVIVSDAANAAVLHRAVAINLDGTIDLVVDHGGRTAADRVRSLEILFPLLSAGGLVFLENTSASPPAEEAAGEVSTSLADRVLKLATGRDLERNGSAASWHGRIEGIALHEGLCVLQKASELASAASDASPAAEPDRRTDTLSETVSNHAAFWAEHKAALTELNRMRVERDVAYRDRDSLSGDLARAHEDWRSRLNEAEARLGELHGRLNEAYARSDEMHVRLEQAIAERNGAWVHLNRLKTSISWRLTTPLRWIRFG